MSLIDEILDLSRIESGELSLSIESVSLQDIISESLTWVSEMANSRDIKIEFNSASFTGVLVSADALRLK